MKSLFLCTLILFICASCEQPPVDEVANTEMTIDPLSCQDGGTYCDMTWQIEKSIKNFPQNIEIVINDSTVFNECNRDSDVTVLRGERLVNITINNFIRLNGLQTFKFLMNDLKDCNESKSEFYKSLYQTYELRNIDGELIVDIKL
jgi:hypothetical protein